ncbi:Ferrous iron uptake protein [Blastochloris viridis]|uniref:Ferrous iron uptake protein n=1 Tax=Blastochloris viridis TaxID=1079 RepID=A0A0S4Q5N8_BLAVI|nr:Ferrous iron uptake protein [Blastochloris viridis]
MVIGILSAWLTHQGAGVGRAKAYLWSGVGAGLVVAVLLGWALVTLGDTLPEETQQAYQATVVLVAAALIVQMVIWMRRHGRTLKRELETSLSEAAAQSSWWGVFVLALIAVAREGSETAIFLYGTLSAGSGSGLLALIGAAAVGFALALATYGLLQLGGRVLSWRVFFRVTEVMLLFLAAALLMTGIGILIDLELLPALTGKLWDTSWLLSDGGTVGGMVSALTGYRARPVGIEVIAFVGYWVVVLWLLSTPRSITATARPTA